MPTRNSTRAILPLLKRATLAELKRGIFIKTDWGNVLPTWHIAAAAVAIQQLGTPIDIQVSSVDFSFRTWKMYGPSPKR